MKEAVKQVASLVAILVFITILLVGYRFDLPLTMELLFPLLIKAFVGASMFWIGGLIIGDIVIKGIVEDIDPEHLEPLQGGFEQRIHEAKRKQRVSIVERQFHIDKTPKGTSGSVKDRKK